MRGSLRSYESLLYGQSFERKQNSSLEDFGRAHSGGVARGVCGVLKHKGGVLPRWQLR